MKVCSICGIEKNDDCFNKKQSRCKLCQKEYNKIYRQKNAATLKENAKEHYNNNREELLLKHREWYQENKEEQCKLKKEYYQNNKEERAIYTKQYYIDHQDHLLEYHKQYYVENKEEALEYQKIYRIEHKEERRQTRREYERERRKNDPIYKLRKAVSGLINIYLHKNGSSKKGNSITDYLPYTMEELKEHLEKQFQEPNNKWMNWDNYGSYKKSTWKDDDKSTWMWNIDHIQPQSDFPFISMTEENCQKCWALSNLRPYSAKQNLLDGNRRNKRDKKTDK